MPSVGKPLGRFVFSKDQPAKVGLSISQQEAAKGRYDAYEWNFQLSKHSEMVRNAKPRVDCHQQPGAIEAWRDRRARAMTYHSIQKQLEIDTENKRIAKQLSAVRSSPSTVHISPKVHSQLRCYPKLTTPTGPKKLTATSPPSGSSKVTKALSRPPPAAGSAHSTAAHHPQRQHSKQQLRASVVQQHLPAPLAPTKARLYAHRIPPRPTQSNPTKL